MAIGTIAAIGLGAAGIGSALGGSSANKAASKAADVSLQVAQENNALAKDIYGQNKASLTPYMQRGNAAGDAINALLGLGGVSQPAQALPTQQPTTPNALSQFSPYGAYGADGLYDPVMSQFIGNKFPGVFGQINQQPYNTGVNGANVPAPAPQSPQNYQTAFDNYRNSTGYQFRLKEGMNALNSGYAGAGMIKSGAAMKAAQDYGQNIASNEFGNYLNALGNQQGVGLSGASALAGVGQNYVNTISANNNSAGSAAANAALIKGQNNPFANALGMIGGGILGLGR